MTYTLAEKLEWLFQHVHKADGQSYSSLDIALKIEASTPGFTVSPSHIWNLRKGLSDNPSWKLIMGLGKAFDVSPLYFFDEREDNQAHADLALLTVLRASGMLHLAQRIGDLSPHGKHLTTTLVEYLITLEQQRT